MGAEGSKSRREQLMSPERSYQQYNEDEDSITTGHMTNSVDNNGNSGSTTTEAFPGQKTSTLVVVKKPKEEPINIELDPLYRRMQEIPMFLPIIDEHSKSFPWSSKKNVQSLTPTLNSKCAIRIGQLYNGYLRKNTLIISKTQNRISKKIKEVDDHINKLMKSFAIRQRQYANYAHKFGQINEMSRMLAKRQITLDCLLKSAQEINDMLPDSEKLEPFEWSESPTPQEHETGGEL